LDFKLAPQNYKRKTEKTTFEAVVTKFYVKLKPNACTSMYLLNSPQLRKFHQWGDVSLSSSGDKEKQEEPNIVGHRH
jgi:hypothetical protein